MAQASYHFGKNIIFQPLQFPLLENPKTPRASRMQCINPRYNYTLQKENWGRWSVSHTIVTVGI